MKLTLTTDRKFLYSMGAIVVGALLLFVSFPIFGRLVSSFRDLNNLKTLVANLGAKRDTLASVDNNTVNSANIVVRALPTKISAMAAVAQIRAAATEKGVNISRIQATVKEGSNPATAQIRIDVEGPLDTIDQFLKVVETTLPYITIGEGKTTKTAELLQTSITFETYWKELPKVGGVEAALPVLTEKERQLLVKLSGFKEVTSNAVPVAEGQGRANPFSF